MAPLPPHLRRPLTVRFQLALKAIAVAAAPRVRRSWMALDTYNESDIETFAADTQPALTAAKFAAVRQAAGYYALTAGVRAVGVQATSIGTAVDPREPFIATWRALKMGAPIEEAVASGASRVEAVVANLVTSSARQTGDVVVERAGLKVVGWERVPDADACDWCLSVAPGFYTSADSADFGHDRDNCTAEPIYA